MVDRTGDRRIGSAGPPQIASEGVYIGDGHNPELKTSRAVVLAGIAIAIAFGPRFLHAARSAQPVTAASDAADAGFDRDQSAALFVGVRRFTQPGLPQVRYAVDDAVDLAYLFVFDQRVHLVPANRVVVALSGRPEKPESRRELEALKRAGAAIRHADQTDIVALLRKQAKLAGKDGLLVVSIASHGFTRNGSAYVLGSSSIVRYPATNVAVANILDIAALSAGRSLVFIDACRERLSAPTRSVRPQAESKPPLLRRMAHAHGQAVFFAAANGQVAYDGNGNGVFTKAVIDGLECHAAKPQGTVTASTLGIHVQNSVLRWIRRHIDSDARPAIQVNFDGDARNMPLSQCWPTCDVKFLPTKSTIKALDAKGKLLWEKGEGTSLRAMAAGDLFRDHQQEPVALWGDGDASRLTIYSTEGQRLSDCDLPEFLDHLAVGRPTHYHAPKIVVAGKTIVMAFDPKKVSRGKPLWTGMITPHGQSVERIEIRDSDKDGKDEITITTRNGTLLLDFKGNLIAKHVKRGSLQFHLLHSRRKRP